MISIMKPKIIIVTPDRSFFRDPHVSAFEALGYECATFSSRNGFVYHPWFRRLSRKISFLGSLKKFKVNLINKGLLDLVKRYKPQYVFVQKGETISPATINSIKGLRVVTVNFYNDFEWSVISKIAPHYDYFFTQHQEILNRLWRELNLKNCFYMAHAAEPLRNPFINRENKYPVSFVGTYNPKIYPNREKYLLTIKDIGLNVWGNDDWVNTSLRECFHGRSHGDERFDIYRQSKIVIDINWEHVQSDGISVRPFEVTASGACLFADLVKQDIKSVYEEGKEFVSFSSGEELRKRVKYYLEHEREREEIARAGYNRTITEHTYAHRMKQLFDTMEHPDKYLYKNAFHK